MSAVLRRTAKFALAGAVGFVVDVAVLALVVAALGPYGGRIVSFLAAATTTWLINRHLAFADRKGSGDPASEFVRYVGVMLVGGSVNYAVYSVVVAVFGDAAPVLVAGVAAGSLSGMGVNLALANWLVFPRARTGLDDGRR